MAVDFKTEHTRTSEYLFLPEHIRFNPELNGRHELPDIEWLVTSMVKHGQLQPVSIKNNGGEPWLHIGHSRWRAGLEINKRKLTPVPFRLRCVYYRGSEMDAFLATIAENRDRNGTTPIDDAHNIARLTRYNMTIQQIADEYREDTAWVNDRLALIDLCEDAQKLVVGRELKPNAAKELAKLSSEAQREKLASIQASGRKITVASIRREVVQGAPADRVSGGDNKPKRLGVPEFKALIQERIDSDLSSEVLAMNAENAVRTVLSEILDKLS